MGAERSDSCSMKYVAGGQPQLEVKEGKGGAWLLAGAYRAVKWLHSSRFNGSATQHKALPAAPPGGTTSSTTITLHASCRPFDNFLLLFVVVVVVLRASFVFGFLFCFVFFFYRKLFC